MRDEQGVHGYRRQHRSNRVHEHRLKSINQSADYIKNASLKLKFPKEIELFFTFKNIKFRSEALN